MSAITYQTLPSEVPIPETPQVASRIFWRNWKLLKPQEELLGNLGKIMAFHGISWFVAGVLGEIPSSRDFSVSDRYYTTCTQVSTAFSIAYLCVTFCTMGIFGYFLKSNQERCNREITPERKAAIQNQVEKAIQIHLERQQER